MFVLKYPNYSTLDDINLPTHKQSTFLRTDLSVVFCVSFDVIRDCCVGVHRLEGNLTDTHTRSDDDRDCVDVTDF